MLRREGMLFGSFSGSPLTLGGCTPAVLSGGGVGAVDGGCATCGVRSSTFAPSSFGVEEHPATNATTANIIMRFIYRLLSWFPPAAVSLWSCPRSSVHERTPRRLSHIAAGL